MKRSVVKIWKRCPECKGTGINPNSLLIEPLRFRVCRRCKGSGWIVEIKEVENEPRRDS